MNKTTTLIFDKYQVRKTKKQKSDFIRWVCGHASSLGYNCTVEKGSLGSRNIIIGNPEKAKVVFTAHYDTSPALPFPNFITPKSITVYILFQLLISLSFCCVSFIITYVIKAVFPHLYTPSLNLLILYGILFLCICAPANKHTANDNTSGVTTVLDILAEIPEVYRDDAAFILFDMEELGMIGSASYYRKHKKFMKNKLLINFDCVSDGKDIIIYAPKKASGFNGILKSSFCSEDGFSVQILNKGVFYPSDQMSFPCGVGAAAFNKTKSGLLYLDKIHTSKDRVYDEANISYLCSSSLKLIKSLSESDTVS